MVLITLIILTALLFFRLYREFGKAQHIVIKVTPDDREKFVKTLQKTVDLQKNSSTQQPQKKPTSQQKLESHFQILKSKFSDFEESKFLKTSEEFFDNLFKSFVSSDVSNFKKLMSNDLYTQFEEQITKRNNAGLNQEVSINHTKTSIDKIQFFAKKAKMWLSFNVSQMSAISKNGKILDNPNKLYRNMIYKWIFEREYDSENWILTKSTANEV